MGLENAVLFLVTEPGIQRQHFGVPQLGMAQLLAQGPDFPLAGQEHQHIPRRLLFRALVLFDFFEGREHPIGPALIPVVFIAGQRAVANIHRIGTAADFDHRSLVKELAEALYLNGGGGDDDLQVRPLGQQLAQVAQQEVDVEAALVGFIDNQGVVLVQKAVVLDFRQQDTVCHHLDPGRLGGVIGETHLITHLLPDLLAQLLRNPGRHTACRNPPGLGMAHQPADAPAQVQADFGNLGGFTGAGFTGNDDHLVLLDGPADVLYPGTDRQAVRKTGRLVQGLSLLHLLQPLVQPACHFLQILLPGPALAPADLTNNARRLLLVTGVQLAHKSLHGCLRVSGDGIGCVTTGRFCHCSVYGLLLGAGSVQAPQSNGKSPLQKHKDPAEAGSLGSPGRAGNTRNQALASSRSSRRRILPTLLLGSSSRNSKCLGTLYAVRRSRQNSLISLAVTPSLVGTT